MSWLRSNGTPRSQDRLERLLDRLLRKEASNMVGHIGVICERTQPSLVAAGLGEQRAGYVVLSRFDKHPALGKRGAEGRARHLAPLLDLGLAVDEHVNRPAQIMQRAAQTHHLGVSVGYLGLENQ